jgi:hypothetical protein
LNINIIIFVTNNCLKVTFVIIPILSLNYQWPIFIVVLLRAISHINPIEKYRAIRSDLPSTQHKDYKVIEFGQAVYQRYIFYSLLHNMPRYQSHGNYQSKRKKVALVTRAANDIGKANIIEFGRAGYTIMINDTSEQELKQATREILNSIIPIWRCRRFLFSW